MKKILLLSFCLVSFGCATPRSVREIEDVRGMLLENYSFNAELFSVTSLKGWRKAEFNHIEYIRDLAIEYHTDVDGKIAVEKYQEILDVTLEKKHEVDLKFNAALDILNQAKNDLIDLLDLRDKVLTYYAETGELNDKFEEIASELMIKIRAKYEMLKEMLEDAIN